MKFTKMQGLGNDFILIDGFKEKVKNPEGLAKFLCHRNFGIGADGLILILPSKKADFKMRIFNPDGTEAEMCGNGIRCLAKYVHQNSYTNKLKINIETLAGIINCKIILRNKKIKFIQVNIGKPKFKQKEIPLFSNFPEEKFINEKLSIKGRDFFATCINLGNPHCVIFVKELKKFPVNLWGPILENYKIFPQRTNVEFVKVLNKNEIKVRIWERGVGETLACGTGACASAIAAILNKKANSPVIVHLPGGKLKIEWKKDSEVFLLGPAEKVFQGEIR